MPQQKGSLQNGRKIFATYTSDWRIISRKYKELRKWNRKEPSDPISKWVTEIKRQSSKDGIQMTNKNTKYTFSLSSHQGIANRLHWGSILPHSEWRSLVKWEQKGTVIHCRWDARCPDTMEVSMEILQNRCSMTQIALLDIYLEDSKWICYRNTCISMLITVLITIAKLYHKTRSLWTEEWI